MARADRAEWAKRIERWRDSGLTAKEFAAETGLKASTLSYWKWRLKSEGKPAPRSTGLAKTTARKQPQGQGLSFVEVAPSAIGTSSFEVELTQGVVVRVPMDFDAEAFDRLLVVLEQRP
jgi:transposase